MITNLHHVGEQDRVRFTMKGGKKFAAPVRNNDRQERVLWIEQSEGFFAAIPYGEIAHVSIRTFSNA